MEEYRSGFAGGDERFRCRHRTTRSLSKCVVDPTSIRGNRLDINYRLLPCTARCTGSDTEATWEDAPLCNRLAARGSPGYVNHSAGISATGIDVAPRFRGNVC